MTDSHFDIYYKEGGKTRFSWDLNKATLNLKKHGVPFEEALTVFDDPDRILHSDPWHSTTEEWRGIVIGTSDAGQELLVVYSDRDFEITRIISARPVNRLERKHYYENQAKNREV